MPPTEQQTSNNQQKEGAGGREARALFDFTSDCDEELSLQVHNFCVKCLHKFADQKPEPKEPNHLSHFPFHRLGTQ